MRTLLERYRVSARKYWGEDGLLQSMLYDDARALTLGQICHKFQPGRVLEIGTLRGLSAGWLRWNLYAEAEIWTMDRHDGEARLKVSNWLERVGSSNVKQVTILTESEKVAWVAARGPWDMVLIDADHSHPGIMMDFAAVEPTMTDGGVIVFDDAGMAGVKKFLVEQEAGGVKVFRPTPSVAYIIKGEGAGK